MTKVNVHQAKTHLSRLIRAALDGEEVVIAKDGVPLVKLVAVEDRRDAPQIGFARGLIEIADDFDAPLQDFEAYR